jgi:hypothetical protein
VRFDGTERLTVSDPQGIGLDEWGGLQVSRASEARYGHHYYGRPQTQENRIEMIFRNQQDRVEIITTVHCWPVCEVLRCPMVLSLGSFSSKRNV